jgi:uncharacterized protein YbjQ (UPF0145 family)
MSSNAPQPPNDLPVHARERLADMRAHRLFTSDLSVSEFVLVREAGFDPVGLVMGTSIYQIAPKIPSLRRGEPGRELVDTTRALYHARELAMNRMEEEADALGADGIIGVRLTVNLSTDPTRVEWKQYRRWSQWSKQLGFRRPQAAPSAGYFSGWAKLAETQWQQWCQQMGWAQIPWPPWTQPTAQASYALGPNTAEFIAIGTAVRHRTGERYKNRRGKPFQSDLSGQDFWLLIRTGFRPVGFVMGNCVYYVGPDMLYAPMNQSCELSAYTHALYDARELAIERLQDEAEALDATGIVGVTIAENQHSWRTTPWNVGNAALQSGELIELFVIGTAVVPVAGGGELPEPELVFSANEVLKRAKGGGE